MKVLIFLGSNESWEPSTGKLISNYIKQQLDNRSVGLEIIDLSEWDIPMMNPIKMNETPEIVHKMIDTFLEADMHIWMAPLYHGSIPGVMKNSLDWLELTAKNESAYLTDKTVALVSWATGSQALHGVQAMTNIAHTLRAWVVPFSLSISTQQLYRDGNRNELSDYQKERIDMLLDISLSKKVVKR